MQEFLGLNGIDRTECPPQDPHNLVCHGGQMVVVGCPEQVRGDHTKVSVNGLNGRLVINVICFNG